MKFGVIVFPGSNCDHDAYHVVSKHVGQPVDFIWHKETDLSGYDAVIVPGGFSYGDYLRAGALARFSPVMKAVKEFRGGREVRFRHLQRISDPVRSGLLPGALMRNAGLHFVCKHVNIRIENQNTPYTNELENGQSSVDPDRTRRRELHLRRRDVSSARRKQPDRVSILRRERRDDARIESERCALEYRGHLQSGPQRPRHDAAPGARVRRAARLKRRPRIFRSLTHAIAENGVGV